MTETNTKPLQKDVSEIDREKELLREMQLTLRKLEEQNRPKLLKHIGSGVMSAYHTLATHVLLLLLGISLTAWWMVRDDSWRSYVSLGCSPNPIHYTERHIPEPIPAKKDMTWKELVQWQDERITQLVLVMNELLIDRDTIRAVCDQ